MAGKIIQVAKIPKGSERRTPTEELLATLCLYYPAYTMKMARTIPAKTVYMMLKKARRHEAAKYHTLTQIAAAPHSDKGKGVKNLMQEFEGIINNG